MTNKNYEILTKNLKKKLPRNDLEEYILDFLKSQNMGVLSTSFNDIPRATPVEYYNNGATLYIIAEEGEKIKNIEKNPNISFSIYASYSGWLSVKGVQITGKAKILTYPSKEFEEGLEYYDCSKNAEQLGIDENIILQDVKKMKMIKIESEKIELFDFSLKEKGYSEKQVLIL